MHQPWFKPSSHRQQGTIEASTSQTEIFNPTAIMLLYYHSSNVRDIPTTLAIYWTIASFSDIYLPYLGILNEIIQISSN